MIDKKNIGTCKGVIHLTGGVHLPVFVDKTGQGYRREDVHRVVATLVLNSSDYLTRRGKIMSTDFEKATEIVDNAAIHFGQSFEKFNNLTDRLAENSKRASGSVRDSTEKLAQGLTRIEKAANFDRLEKYVELLERASAAMQSLAELERTGKLERIAAAVR